MLWKKSPSLIEKYEKENEKISSDLPVLQEIVRSTWRRENELKDLKTKLAALDRKIQLSLKPVVPYDINKFDFNCLFKIKNFHFFNYQLYYDPVFLKR
jgi:hypothetical protein